MVLPIRNQCHKCGGALSGKIYTSGVSVFGSRLDHYTDAHGLPRYAEGLQFCSKCRSGVRNYILRKTSCGGMQEESGIQNSINEDLGDFAIDQVEDLEIQADNVSDELQQINSVNEELPQADSVTDELPQIEEVSYNEQFEMDANDQLRQRANSAKWWQEVNNRLLILETKLNQLEIVIGNRHSPRFLELESSRESVKNAVDQIEERISSMQQIVMQQTDSESDDGQKESGMEHAVVEAVYTDSEPSQVQCERPTVSNSCPSVSTKKPARLTETTIVLQVRSIPYTEKWCCICHDRSNRANIPFKARDDVWITERILIPPKARACKKHLSNGLFSEEAKHEIKLMAIEFATTSLTEMELRNFINRLTDKLVCKPGIVDFNEDLPLTTYKLLLGIEKEDFESMYETMRKGSGLRDSPTRSLKNALALFLMKLRTGVSQKVLAHIFGIESQATVSLIIDTVSRALESTFVKENMGFEESHTDRNKAITHHNSDFVSRLFTIAPENLNLTIDATYVYIQKPGNHVEQRRTYSIPKSRNLFKIMKIVLDDGYILEAEGVWFCDSTNNDAAIILKMLEEKSAFREFIQEGDNFIFDRGFRDAVLPIRKMDMQVQIPAFKTSKQFTTEEANYTRKVTICRNVVESANGRIKSMFKFFENTVPHGYKNKISRFYRIACAITNRFCPPLRTFGEQHDYILEQCLQRENSSNVLKETIDSLGIEKKRTIFRVENAIQVDFPSLTVQNIFEITLGPYQISKGQEYFRQQAEADLNMYMLKVYKPSPNIIQAKVSSRFHKDTERTVWVEFDKALPGSDAIIGFYCTCPVGARVIGTCSHVTAVLWFLGYARHHRDEIKKYKSVNHILDAAIKLSRNDDNADIVVDGAPNQTLNVPEWEENADVSPSNRDLMLGQSLPDSLNTGIGNRDGDESENPCSSCASTVPPISQEPLANYGDWRSPAPEYSPMSSESNTSEDSLSPI